MAPKAAAMKAAAHKAAAVKPTKKAVAKKAETLVKGKTLKAAAVAAHNKKVAPLTLDAKLQLLKGKTPDEVKARIKDFTKLEKSKLWNRHNTACKHNPELAADRAAATSKEAKGVLALAFNLEPGGGPLYSGLKKTVAIKDSIIKTTQWMSWKQITDLKGEDDVTAWLQSGRVTWRQCPKTPGVYEYSDTMDYKGEKAVEHTKVQTKSQSQSAMLEDKGFEQVDELLEKTFQQEVYSMQGADKGKGKGNALGSTKTLAITAGLSENLDSMKGKGKGKNKGKGNREDPLALKDKDEDEDPTEEQQELLDKAVAKTRVMQTLMGKTKQYIMELVPGLKKNPFASKAMIDAVNVSIKDLDLSACKVQKLLVQNTSGKTVTVEVFKKTLSEAAAKVSSVQEWKKKIAALDHDDSRSDAASKRSKK